MRELHPVQCSNVKNQNFLIQRVGISTKLKTSGYPQRFSFLRKSKNLRKVCHVQGQGVQKCPKKLKIQSSESWKFYEAEKLSFGRFMNLDIFRSLNFLGFRKGIHLNPRLYMVQKPEKFKIMKFHMILSSQIS